MHARGATPWLVFRGTGPVRWGGDLRRRFLLEPLVAATHADEATGWGVEAVRAGLRTSGGGRWPWQRHPRVASADTFSRNAIAILGRAARPILLDVHDHPVLQAEALGVDLDAATRAAAGDRFRRNVDAFALLAAPSASFARLAGLELDRTLVAPNGSDVRHVIPRPFPASPTIGMVSGAARGRGIELIVAAARLLRRTVPGLALRLWLTAAEPDGPAFLESVRAAISADPWISLGDSAYDDLADALGSLTVSVIPHPANAYMDVAVPVKLADSLAAGRPVVATPRTETRRVIEAAGAGAVASDDSPEALAAAIRPYLADPDLAASTGAAARAAAERDFDWAVIGRRLADAVLERAGPDGDRG